MTEKRNIQGTKNKKSAGNLQKNAGMDENGKETVKSERLRYKNADDLYD